MTRQSCDFTPVPSRRSEPPRSAGSNFSAASATCSATPCGHPIRTVRQARPAAGLGEPLGADGPRRRAEHRRSSRSSSSASARSSPCRWRRSSKNTAPSRRSPTSSRSPCSASSARWSPRSCSPASPAQHRRRDRHDGRLRRNRSAGSAGDQPDPVPRRPARARDDVMMVCLAVVGDLMGVARRNVDLAQRSWASASRNTRITRSNIDPAEGLRHRPGQGRRLRHAHQLPRLLPRPRRHRRRQGVGVATTRTVVLTIVALITVDLMFTRRFLLSGIYESFVADERKFVV